LFLNVYFNTTFFWEISIWRTWFYGQLRLLRDQKTDRERLIRCAWKTRTNGPRGHYFFIGHQTRDVWASNVRACYPYGLSFFMRHFPHLGLIQNKKHLVIIRLCSNKEIIYTEQSPVLEWWPEKKSVLYICILVVYVQVWYLQYINGLILRNDNNNNNKRNKFWQKKQHFFWQPATTYKKKNHNFL